MLKGRPLKKIRQQWTSMKVLGHGTQSIRKVFLNPTSKLHYADAQSSLAPFLASRTQEEFPTILWASLDSGLLLQECLWLGWTTKAILPAIISEYGLPLLKKLKVTQPPLLHTILRHYKNVVRMLSYNPQSCGSPGRLRVAS